jgi:hypothetical protein
MATFLVKTKSTYDGLETYSVSLVNGNNIDDANLIALQGQCHDSNAVIDGLGADDLGGDVIHEVVRTTEVKPEHVAILSQYL